MLLIARNSNVVVSVAYQVMKTGRVIAHVYFDAKVRSFEDCVRYGRLAEYSSLSSLIDKFVDAYGKVSISAHY